jgi:hypothetical protein
MNNQRFNTLRQASNATFFSTAKKKHDLRSGDRSQNETIPKGQP